MQSFQVFAEAYLIPVQLLLAMVGMGATLRVADFALVLQHPKGLALGLGLQLLVVPALAAAYIAVLGLSDGWAVGLILVAAVPGGAMSNLFTYLGKGSVPLSIAVTTTTTFLCMATVPVVLGLLAQEHLPPDFAFPYGRIVRDIVAFLLVPLLVGMAVLRFAPTRALAFSQWSIRASVAIIALLVVSSLGSGRIQVAAYGFGPPLTIIGFGVLLALVTPQVVRLAGRYDDDNLALSVEVVVRNTGIALLLFHFFFPDQPQQIHVLYTCLFFAGLSPFLAVPLVLRHRAGRSMVLLRRRHVRAARSEAGSSA